MNPCGEVVIGKSEWCNLPYPYYESPNLTYPTVTRWGIKEMTKQQQRNYVKSTMRPDERAEEDIRTLEQRVTYLEQVVKMLLKER